MYVPLDSPLVLCLRTVKGGRVFLPPSVAIALVEERPGEGTRLLLSVGLTPPVLEELVVQEPVGVLQDLLAARNEAYRGLVKVRQAKAQDRRAKKIAMMRAQGVHVPGDPFPAILDTGEEGDEDGEEMGWFPGMGPGLQVL